MIRQFLLNEDGSVPAHTNIEMLREQGIPLVLPTPRFRPSEGMILKESDPCQDADGVWRQVWIEEPAPIPEDDYEQ